MSGFHWVKWVSAQVKRSWWVSVVAGQRAELGVDLATARLDAEDVDQLLVRLDEAGLDRQGAAEGGLGLPDPSPLPLDPPGQQVGLSGHRVIVGDTIDLGEGVVGVAFRGGELGFRAIDPVPVRGRSRSSRRSLPRASSHSAGEEGGLGSIPEAIRVGTIAQDEGANSDAQADQESEEARRSGSRPPTRPSLRGSPARRTVGGRFGSTFEPDGCSGRLLFPALPMVGPDLHFASRTCE